MKAMTQILILRLLCKILRKLAILSGTGTSDSDEMLFRKAEDQAHSIVDNDL